MLPELLGVFRAKEILGSARPRPRVPFGRRRSLGTRDRTISEGSKHRSVYALVVRGSHTILRASIRLGTSVRTYPVAQVASRAYIHVAAETA